MVTKKDFDPDELITANKNHEQQISELSSQIKELQGRVLTSEDFAKSFYDAAKNDKRVDEVVRGVIDEHDKHKIIMSGLSIAKWASAMIIGGLIGTFITILVSGK